MHYIKSMKKKKKSVVKFSSTQCNKSARLAFDKAVNLLSTLWSGEVHLQCNQTECDSWRKGFNNIFLWVEYKIPADVTDTLMEKNFWLYQNKVNSLKISAFNKKEQLPKHEPGISIRTRHWATLFTTFYPTPQKSPNRYRTGVFTTVFHVHF